jgi:hypothetical protein
MHQVRHFEEEPGPRSAAKLLSEDEARRITANIAKLPELPCKACALEQDQDCNHYRESDYSSGDPSQIFQRNLFVCPILRSMEQ